MNIWWTYDEHMMNIWWTYDEYINLTERETKMVLNEGP